MKADAREYGTFRSKQFSENCRYCDQFNADIVGKQKEFVRPMHEQFLAGQATCIDCHKGIAHTAPQE